MLTVNHMIIYFRFIDLTSYSLQNKLASCERPLPDLVMSETVPEVTTSSSEDVESTCSRDIQCQCCCYMMCLSGDKPWMDQKHLNQKTDEQCSVLNQRGKITLATYSIISFCLVALTKKMFWMGDDW